MQPSVGVAMMMTCLTLGFGCCAQTDPDYVGPRTNAFAAGMASEPWTPERLVTESAKTVAA